jgi:hypothetical protein
MANLWAFLAGLAATLLLCWCVGPLVTYVENKIKAQYPNETVPDRSKGDVLVGFLEGIIFFASFWKVGVALAATWLAFKTAAKWETRRSLKEDDRKSLAEIAVRYRGFVIGTAANIICGLAGAGIAHVLASCV